MSFIFCSLFAFETIALGGDISIARANVSRHRQMRNVDVLVIHPEFDEVKLKNDLAYIRVRQLRKQREE